MRPRTRILAFGSAAAVAIAGALCLAFVAGLAGVALGVVLLSFGLGGVVLLVFLEIGLSEDQARAREEQRPRALSQRHVEIRHLRRSRRPPRQRG